MNGCKVERDRRSDMENARYSYEIDGLERRTVKSLSRLADSIERERKEYWTDLQHEIRQNRALRKELQDMRSKADRYSRSASKAERDRMNIIRSFRRLKSRDSNRPVSSHNSTETKMACEELCRALEAQLCEERECRRGLKQIFRERLLDSLEEISRLDRENGVLIDRLETIDRQAASSKTDQFHLVQSIMIRIHPATGIDRSVQCSSNFKSVATSTGLEDVENIRPVINVHGKTRIRKPFTATHICFIRLRL